MQRRHSSAMAPNWAPAFAGVTYRFDGVALGFGRRGVEVQLATFPPLLVHPRRRVPSLDPRLRGETILGFDQPHDLARQRANQC